MDHITSRTIDLSPAECAHLWHMMERVHGTAWTKMEHALYKRLRNLHDVDLNHVGRESTAGTGNERSHVSRERSTVMPGMRR